jgi:hypothetical protein
MAVVTTLVAMAWFGIALDDGPSELAAAAAAPGVEQFAKPTPPSPPPAPGPKIAFEVRDITVASPDWRGKMLNRLEPIARQEGAAVWAVEQQGLAELLKYCPADPRCNVVQSPRMVADVGAPARVSNETTHKYVAHVKRVSDGPPNEGTRIAFTPEIAEVHDGIRVNVASSRLKGGLLFARLTIEENHLLSFVTTHYSESTRPNPDGKKDDGVVKTSLLDRLRPESDGSMRINAVINVPEMVSNRVEGEWLVPSEGALLVSLGANSRRDKGLRTVYHERLVAVTARPAEPTKAP